MTPCTKRGTTSVTVDGEEKSLCSWHTQVWEQHHVLKPPPRRRKQIVTVDTEEIFSQSRALLPLAPSPPRARGRTRRRTGARRCPDAARARRGHHGGAVRGHRARPARGAHERNEGEEDTLPLVPGGFEVRLPDHGASISAAKSLLDLVVSRPKPEVEPGLEEIRGEGFDSRSLHGAASPLPPLTEEDVVERIDEETLAEQVERVVDIAERFMVDPRDVSPAEVTEAKAMLTAMRHYEAALAPIRRLRVDWREPLEPDSDIPPAPRFADE